MYSPFFVRRGFNFRRRSGFADSSCFSTAAFVLQPVCGSLKRSQNLCLVYWPRTHSDHTFTMSRWDDVKLITAFPFESRNTAIFHGPCSFLYSVAWFGVNILKRPPVGHPSSPYFPQTMQLHLTLWALAMSLASFATAQSDSFAPSGGMTPTWDGVSGTDMATASPTFWASSSSSSYEDNTIHKGPIIGAAIGGSIAASLAVVAVALFCVRYRVRRTHMVSIGGAMDNNTARYNDLEAQVVALRAEVDRLVGLQQSGGGAVMYTNEKDAEAGVGKGAGDKGEKETLPTYGD
ncbi:hypothetical protein C8R43DRAFT_660029 [Mycena crocata]|nr:hypothetical protein C8R43DRAFT_660029 [Mycena crocata]